MNKRLVKAHVTALVEYGFPSQDLEINDPRGRLTVGPFSVVGGNHSKTLSAPVSGVWNGQEVGGDFSYIISETDPHAEYSGQDFNEEILYAIDEHPEFGAILAANS